MKIKNMEYIDLIKYYITLNNFFNFGIKFSYHFF